MKEKTIIKWILCSIGVSWILQALTMFLVLIALCIDNILLSEILLIGWTGLVLLGLELIRKQLMGEYQISFLKWFLLTVLPPILTFVIWICFYFFVITNNKWLGLLVEVLFYISIVDWGICLIVLNVGILLIAFIRYVAKSLIRKIKKM